MKANITRRRAGTLGVGLILLWAALMLILQPSQSTEAARQGLQLCYRVIIPSLFPFFVLSSLTVSLGFTRMLGRAMEGLMRPLFHLNGACASALALGLIGGYPVGARTAAELYQSGQCTRTEAERMLAFCNNCGPAFIFGMVGAGVFGSAAAGLMLYAVHVLASLCVGLLFRFYGRDQNAAAPTVRPSDFPAVRLSAAFTDAVKGAFMSTLNICAFVVFFTVVIRLLAVSGVVPVLSRVLAGLFSSFGVTEQWAQSLLGGILEVSTGVTSLTEGSLAVRMVTAAFLLGWGGLSVHCQTLSLTGPAGLSSRTYFPGKLLHALLSALLILPLLRLFPDSISAAGWLTGPVAAANPPEPMGVLLYSLLACAALLLFFLLPVLFGRKRRRKKGGKSKKTIV